jgi:sugar phosphate isomerase/epimerase
MTPPIATAAPRRVYSLAQLIALPYTPPQMVQLAADTGCDACGIRIRPSSPGGPFHALETDTALRRKTLARIAGTGVKVLDVEILRITPDFDLADCRAFLEVCAELGARHVLTAGLDEDQARLTAHYAALCDLAAPYGLSLDLEFMPWTAVKSVGDAARIVAAVQKPNAAVLVDALHWARSASTLDEVTALPRSALNYAQICDGRVPGPTTVEGLIHDARCERLQPGVGGIPLRELFARLPADLPISVEVPDDKRAPVMGYEAWAKQCFAAAKRVLEGQEAGA